MTVKPSTTLNGTVEKIIRSLVSNEPERAQIVVEGAEHLYRELRIENALIDAAGNRVHLKPGAKVQVTVVAQSYGVMNKIQYDAEDRNGRERAKHFSAL